VTDAPHDVIAPAAAEDLETQPFGSRGQVGKFCLVKVVNVAHLFLRVFVGPSPSFGRSR
jgi:hypothetical protein